MVIENELIDKFKTSEWVIGENGLLAQLTKEGNGNPAHMRIAWNSQKATFPHSNSHGD